MPRRSVTASRRTSSTSIRTCIGSTAEPTCCPSSSRRPAAIGSRGTRSSGTTRRRARPSSTRTRDITATTGRPSSDAGPDGRIALWREWQHLDDAQDWDSQAPRPGGGSVAARLDRSRPGRDAGRWRGARRAPSTATSSACGRCRSHPNSPVRGGAWFAGRAVAVHLGVESELRARSQGSPGVRRGRPRAVR